MDSSVMYVISDLSPSKGVGMGANGYAINSLTGHDIPAACGVYLLTDTITGRTYVGGSKNIRARAVQHFYHMRGDAARYTTYAIFGATYKEHGGSAFSMDVLELCAQQDLYAREQYWIKKLQPTENTHHSSTKALAYTDEERALRSERTRKLWATPEYHKRASEARKGNSFAKGHKCTPEQVENRRRAARISNMKRNYAPDWQAEYIKRYPEHVEDVNA